uniref:Glutaredoxin domain-containing protein n=1 Tax=Caenorhabditis tropicalis TaxID=1561998 RepID=A0A1I7UYS1_9PELO
MISNNERRNIDYLNSSFLPFWRRNAFVYKSELAFSILILICAFAEFVVYNCYVTSLLMSIASFVFALLFFEFYFGSVYNCAALLHLHTLSAGFISLCCWFSVLIPIFFGESVYLASRSVVHVIYKYYGCQVIFGSLLASFAVASFSRRKEIRAVELSHVDYLKRLMKMTAGVAGDVQKEAREFNIKPRDIHSIS